MKLWHISQTENNDYDTYDSAVVAAATMVDARSIHPGGDDGNWKRPYSSWASDPSKVTVKLLGDAAPGIERGVWCASFNAG